MINANRIYPAALPPTAPNTGGPWDPKDRWPASWITPPAHAQAPFACAFRLPFTQSAPVTARIHVTADERYELFLDGQLLARGPERGDRAHWYYESFDLPLTAGPHSLIARVWCLGNFRPWAQAHVKPGFLLYAQDPSLTQPLSTGLAPWQTKLLPGILWSSSSAQIGQNVGIGPTVEIDAATFPVHYLTDDLDWLPAPKAHPGNNGFNISPFSAEHILAPATLLPQIHRPITQIAVRRADDTAAWQQLIDSHRALTVPPHSRQTVILDLQNYYAAYPSLVTTGGKGSTVRIAWAEALYDPTGSKANRDTVGEYIFKGFGDTFRPDGQPNLTFTTPWWRPGRYVEVSVTTDHAPLTIDALTFHETRYPLEPDAGPAAWATSDQRLASALRVALRTLQSCAHETYMDCPYYEQLMYIGDTRLQILITHMLTLDARLPRKALTLINSSAANYWGLPTDAYPSGGKFIPPFALWFVSMLFDHAMYRGEPAFLAPLLPTARTIIEKFLAQTNPDSLTISPPGWNFADSTALWYGGVPPSGLEGGVSAIINLQLLQALRHLAALESFLREPEFAQRATRKADALAAAIEKAFWSAPHQLFADDLTHQHFSQHAQALAVLTHAASSEKTHAAMAQVLASDSKVPLATTTIYFSHYLFEAAREAGLAAATFPRLTPWYDAVDAGFKTFPETFGSTRSDCHAWAAHPLFHFSSTFLGIRPAAPAFSAVLIQPCPGPLQHLSATIAHPQGPLHANLVQHADHITLDLDLPNVPVNVRWNNTTQTCTPGRHHLKLPKA